MPRIITIDFETYYGPGYGFRTHTTEEYVRDREFEVIGVAVKVDAGPTEWFSGSMLEVAEFLHRFPWESCVAVAHNAKFDMAVLNWKFGILPKKILCTMAMARGMVGLATSCSLEKLGEYFHLPMVKGHEVEAAFGKRLNDFTPAHLASYGAYCVNDVEMTYKLFTEHLLPMYQQVPTELNMIDWTMRAFVEPELVLDAQLIEHEYRSFLARRSTLLASAGIQDIAQLRSDGTMANLLESLGVVPPTKVSPATGEITWAFSKQDVEFMDLREHEDERVVALVEARLGSKTSQVQSRLERFAGIARRGPLPIPLEYAGATPTRRWAGTDKVNLQNLPRNKLDKDTKQIIYSPLRKAVRAPQGRKLGVADLSQIELRVNAWQSGQTDVLDLLRNGGDTYSDMATVIYGFEITKAMGKSTHANERFVGKTAVLGCGYQCGGPKFQTMLKVAARREGIVLPDESLDFAENVVGIYRKKNDRIRNNWYRWNDALEILALGGTCEIGPYRVADQKVWLPNGAFLYYPELQRREKQGRNEQGVEWSYYRMRGRNKVLTKLYGGKLVENITQACARLFVSDAMLRLQTIKYRDGTPVFRIVLTVHDEVVVTFTDGLDEAWVMDCMKWAMTTPPPWAPDIPLAYEGSCAYSYAEAK